MKIAIIGATGNVGSRVVKEALNRGHKVTGICRHPEKLPAHENLKAVKGDVHKPEEISKILAVHDLVISAVHFADFDGQELIDEIKNSGVKRYISMGGAGSLEIEPGVQLIDTPDFPPEFFGEASPGRDYLNLLRQEKDLEWTFLCPQLYLVPGERTGKFRIGKDELLFNEKGESTISIEDLAVAMIDEAENPQHIRERFTVGY